MCSAPTTARLLDCVNPATNDVFDRVPVTSPEAVQAAHNELRTAWPRWRDTTLTERIRVLRQFQALVVKELDRITLTINRDGGKSRQDALIEVFVTLNLLDDLCRNAPRWLAREKVSSGLQVFKECYVEHRPRGVVGIIAPWNYPFNLALGPALTALIAGNAVLIKPSEVTAATGKLIAWLFEQVPGLSPYIRVLHGDGETGAALVKSAPDYVFLTGSGPTAHKILAAAAENLTPVSLELGGKDATIVLEDADLESAARWSVWGAFFNAGQTCMAVERVYVVEPVYKAFVERVVAETEKLRLGYSESRVTPYHLGPITMPRQMTIVEAHLQDALMHGAEVRLGGRRHGMFFEPTVLLNVNHDMQVMREETFGPLLPIMRVANEEEAIRQANDSKFALGGSVWSEDPARVQRVMGRLRAASLLANDAIAQFGVPGLPFGGVGASGTGRTHGREGLRSFTLPYAMVLGGPPKAFDIATLLREPGTYHQSAAVLRSLYGTTPGQKLGAATELGKSLPQPALWGGAAAVLGGSAALIWRWLRRRG